MRSLILGTKAAPALTGLLLSIGLMGCSGRKWDQERAVATVNEVIAIEQESEIPWDKIEWKTDPHEVASLARKEQKPIFVYLYLKKNVGPPKAPC